MKYSKMFIASIFFAGQLICSNQDISQSCNTFACNIYKQLKEKSGNIFFSPSSISTALSVAYVGARGETEKQMANVLNNTFSQEEFHSAYANVINKLNKKNSNYQLAVANKLFVQDGYNILDSFKNQIISNYGGVFDIVDFITNPADASELINNWVKEMTHKKIEKIVSPKSFDVDTRMIIANAIYFKGKWVKQFKKSATLLKPFYISKDNKIDTDMMHQKSHFNYMKNDDFKMLELPYEGDRLSMFVILPHQIEILKNIEENLSEQMLHDCFSQLKNVEVDVTFPKFKLETKYTLNSFLKQMGMPLAFSGGFADFSGISGVKELFISQVSHKAFIKTDEEGTEAAAVTGITFKLELMREDYETFNANKSFLFFIKDKITNVILFMGRIDNPNI